MEEPAACHSSSMWGANERAFASEPPLRTENAPYETTEAELHSSPATGYEPPLRRSNGLQFITMTDPTQSRASNNRRLVRAHAMRHVRQRRPTPPEISSPGFSIIASEDLDSGSTNAQFAQNGIFAPEAYESSFQINIPKSHDEACSLAQGEFDKGQSSRKTKAASLSSQLGAGRTDPFLSFAIEMKPYMHFLIDHYAQVIGPSHTPPGETYSPLVEELVPLARKDPGLFHVLLCLTAAHITSDKGIKTPQYVETYHRGEAFRLLAHSLSDPNQATSDLTIASITMLSGFDVIFKLSEAHEAHMKGLDRIVAERGGLDNLGYKGFLKMLVTWASHFRTQRRLPISHTMGPEIGLDNSRTSGKSSPINIRSLPIGFQELRKNRFIGETLTDLIETIWYLTALVDSALDPAMDAATENDHEIRMKVEQQLEALQLSHSLGPQGSVLCMALILYDHTVLRPIPNCSATHIDQADELKRALERSRLDVEAWGRNYKILLWILFIGFSSTMNRDFRYWFASYAQDIILWSHLSLDAEGLKSILKSFLWHEAAHGRPLQELWSQIVKAPPYHCHCGHDHSF